MHQIVGKVVDILQREIYPAKIEYDQGIIRSIEPVSAGQTLIEGFILPGFIDAHVHIESSLLVPSEFARLAVVHGTVATISDPHEIANVCGLKGIEYMLEDGKRVPFKFYFGAPSCVPATDFETAGAAIDAGQVSELLARSDIRYLSEMMNYPGVLNKDREVYKKIQAARASGKPVDGHAPGLRGEAAKRYIAAGISTDHECFTREEALDKLQYGMKIIIREGSAAKNFDTLVDLLQEYPDMIMFCSDDKHPDSLLEGHIDKLCARAVGRRIGLFEVLRAASLNPVLHYGLDVGLLRINDPADFIVVKDLDSFEPLRTYIGGHLVAIDGKSLINTVNGSPPRSINNFTCHKKGLGDFVCFLPHGTNQYPFPVIEALDGQLITNKISAALRITAGIVQNDLANDILKMVVVNRYHNAPVSKAFVKGFGLTRGALASSVAHDSHNIVAVGVDDESLCRAVNLVIGHQGGICCVDEGDEMILPLPVAGLMSYRNGYEVAQAYIELDKKSKQMGSRLSSPLMTLSFMALLVIPHLKLSDKGLFDGDNFTILQ